MSVTRSRFCSLVLALWAAAAFITVASAAPDTYAFEVRFADDNGREIVATCRGIAPCVVEQGAGDIVSLAVQVEVTNSDVSVGIIGHEARFVVRNAAGSDGLDVRTRGPGQWIAVRELPAVLRIVRYERSATNRCPGLALCGYERGSDRRVGSGHLMIRPIAVVPREQQ